MSQAVVPFRHPLLQAVDDLAALLDSVADSQPVFLPTREKETLLVGLRRQISRLEAIEAKALAGAGDVAEEHGARSAGAWLAHETRQDPPVGRVAQRFADGLDQRWPVVAQAYGAGAVSTAQARVIGKALDDLPADLDPDLRTRAEHRLVGEAAHFCPRDLRTLGRRVLEVLAPDVAEAHEARLLAREEQSAWDSASITHRRLGSGLLQSSRDAPRRDHGPLAHPPPRLHLTQTRPGRRPPPAPARPRLHRAARAHPRRLAPPARRHDTRYDTTRMPSGQVRFHRRT